MKAPHSLLSPVFSLVSLLALCACLFLTPCRPALTAAPAPIKAKGDGLVVSSHELADKIGMDVLAAGGNAIDAAVAVGYALAVVHPAAGNIGGGGFAVVRMADGTTATLDFREKAPLKASPNMYLDGEGKLIPEASAIGHKAAGVPGTVAGMSALLERFGSKKLSELIAPAVTLAERGYQVSAWQEKSLAEFAGVLSRFASSRKYFLKADGSPYQEGEIHRQTDLAKTLRAIAKDGPDAFYRGPIADLIASDMAANNGLIGKDDLSVYAPIWREPATGAYRGYEILSMGPPSAGGALTIQMLNVMENEDVAAMGSASSESIHLMAEAMRYAYADRAEHIGDPDFTRVPLNELTSKEYAKKIHSAVKALWGNPVPSKNLRPGLAQMHEGANTTHYSVVDKWGNAVALTYTINESYGCAAAVEGAGFLLNNEMNDFWTAPGPLDAQGKADNEANRVAPGKRPASSMSPTIVLKDGRLFMTAGSPGGPRIITSVLQVISNVIDHGMNISEAVTAPRFHMQWMPDELKAEKYCLTKDVEKALGAMGYKISEQKSIGDVNAILVDQESGILYGAEDPRTGW